MSSSTHCARPGCSSPPVALLAYDYQRRVAWLHDVGSRVQGTTWLLCIAHADSMRVPVGWSLEDSRAEVVGLHSTPRQLNQLRGSPRTGFPTAAAAGGADTLRR